MPLPDGPIYVCKVLELTGLCWELRQGVFLFPRGLPDGKPYDCDQWEEIGHWEWGFLPEDSFHRFLVRMHERKDEVVRDGEGNWQHWRGAVVVEHPPGCRAVILANPARGRLEARLDPNSQEPEGRAVLCEFVGDMFEKEIVKHAADRKRLPSSNVIEPKFASIVVIHKAIESVVNPDGNNSTCVPNRNNMSRWKVRDKRNDDGSRVLHIGEALDYYEKYYLKREKVKLEPEDRMSMESRILKSLQRGS